MKIVKFKNKSNSGNVELGWLVEENEMPELSKISTQENFEEEHLIELMSNDYEVVFDSKIEPFEPAVYGIQKDARVMAEFIKLLLGEHYGIDGYEEIELCWACANQYIKTDLCNSCNIDNVKLIPHPALEVYKKYLGEKQNEN